jgi:5-methyltetrahydropteroyltriglutamate--homocysteine methyltransferase
MPQLRPPPPPRLHAQGEAYPWVAQLPVATLTLDFCGVPGATIPNATLALIKAHGWPAGKRLGAGCVDGRSVWADDEGERGPLLRAGVRTRVVSFFLSKSFSLVPPCQCKRPLYSTILIPAPPSPATKRAAACASLLAELRSLGASDLAVTSSVSLQHLPWDLALETTLPAKLAPRLAFAVQKLGTIARLAQGAAPAAGGAKWGAGVADHVQEVPSDMFKRAESFEARRGKQPQFLPFPTTSSESRDGRGAGAGSAGVAECARQGRCFGGRWALLTKRLSPPPPWTLPARSRLLPADRPGPPPARAAQVGRAGPPHLRAPD